MPFTAYLINHTHWDREWFLTSVYTTPWIAGLMDRLAGLVEENPDFHFLLDGQTLVIEDLLRSAPDYREIVDRLVQGGNLLIGPYYCQPDWRLTGGEALVRNFLHGRQDMQQHQAAGGVGWLVDTFGHISQAPQLHRSFGIDSVYIWRGAPIMEPYLDWRSPDGSHLFTVNLFGGYRNLYGVTHAPEVAAQRLQAEIAKLGPYYPSGDIPLFDGYDLEDNPEDPVRFYHSRAAELPAEIQVREATPASFAQEIRQNLDQVPEIAGELNSGKYGAVFPGTLSTRTYLKVLARDCEQLLYGVCEPLGALAHLHGRPYPAEAYAAWSRSLLQNAVHDCICGVSIDQVHEKMEYSYRQVWEGMLADIRESLACLLDTFAPGIYAVSTNPYDYAGWLVAGGDLVPVRTYGIGVWEAGEHRPLRRPAQPVEHFRWQNPHYTALVRPDGTLAVGAAVLGRLEVYREDGDTYSEESGPLLGVLAPAALPEIEQASDRHATLRIAFSGAWEQVLVTALVRLTFDESPLIRWEIELDSRGAGLRVELVFELAQPGQVYAGMPFDIVQREAVDADRLPRDLEPGLAAVLLGQRELGAVRTFPFHDFVAVSDGATTAAVLAHGLHAYRAEAGGRLALTLRRSVEWLAKPGLKGRVGDAGPFFYVPDARCERAVTHRLAVTFLSGGVDSARFQALNAGFQNPPLLVQAHTAGNRRHWQFFQAGLPLTSLSVAGSRVLGRVFNPASQAHRLPQEYGQTDPAGRRLGTTRRILPGQIVTLALAELPDATAHASPGGAVEWLNAPRWRVGPNHGLPAPAVLAQLEEKITRLQGQVAAAAAGLAQATGAERYRRQHQVYVLERELLEYQLSARLNELKLAQGGLVTEEYLFRPDAAVAETGRQLNQLRIKRRIYDYIVQAVSIFPP